MKIESSSYRIKDDFGLLFEVKPLSDIPNDVATEEISNFFRRYRIISAFKETNPIDKRKETLAGNKPVSEEHIRPAKLIPMVTLVHIVRDKLASPFNMDTFLQYMDNNKEYEGYTSDDKRYMWKSVHAHLTRNRLIELTNPGAPKTQYKYKYIGTDRYTDNTLRDLKEGKSITL